MRRKEWLIRKLLLDKPELLEKLDTAGLKTAEVADTVGKFMVCCRTSRSWRTSAIGRN